MSEITIHQGFEEIKFGMTEAEVIEKLGQPNHQEEDLEDDVKETTLVYDNLGLDVSFGEEENFKLGSMTFYSNKFKIKGLEVIGISEDNLQSKFKSIDITDLEKDEEMVEDDSTIYYSDDNSLYVWISEGVAKSFTIFPEFPEEA